MKLNKHTSSFINSPSKPLNDLIIKTERTNSTLYPLSPDIQSHRSALDIDEKKQKLFKNLSHERLSDLTTISPSNDHLHSEKTLPIIFSTTKAINLAKLKNKDQFTVEQLEAWLKKMIKAHIPDIDVILKKKLVPRSDITKKVEDIYCVAIDEIIKQVASQNRLRAELLEKAFGTLKYVWNSYPQHLQYLLEKEKEYYEKRSHDLEVKYKQKVEKHKLRLKVSLMRVRKLEEEKESMGKELGILRKSSLDYREEISNLVRHEKRNECSIGVQAELDCRARPVASPNTSPAFKALTSGSHSLLSIPLESAEIIRSEIRKKAILEISSVTGYKEAENLKQLEDLVEDVCEKVESLNDWIFGFKAGYRYSSPTKKNSLLYAPSSTLTEKSNNSRTNTRVRSFKLESENLSANQIISKLLDCKEEGLQEFSKNTQKKILKHINKSIYSGFGKSFTKESTLAEMVLQGLVNRYNIRKIAEQKMKEFVVGCILNSNDNSRVRMFSCALGCGSYTKNVNFPLTGCEVYFKLFENMISCKVGIILEVADPLNIDLYPLSRAYEVIRIVFGKNFSSENINSLMAELKKLSVPDGNYVNKEGFISLDLFVETCMEAYLEFFESVRNGVKIAVKAITELNYLTQGEFFLLVRQLAVDKLDLCRAVKIDKNNEIEIEDCLNTCLECGAMVEDEVIKFLSGCERDWKIVEREIETMEQELGRVAWKDGITEEEWKEKLEELRLALKGKRSERHLNMWHLMKCDFMCLRR